MTTGTHGSIRHNQAGSQIHVKLNFAQQHRNMSCSMRIAH
jgi:hypothetical protein